MQYAMPEVTLSLGVVHWLQDRRLGKKGKRVVGFMNLPCANDGHVGGVEELDRAGTACF